ncbi:MAG: FliM/FliN family flagellar motor switch protein [Planctomycetota bacterium]
MSELDPEETAALQDAAREETQRRVAVVSPRDFTEPRTLSADRIDHIKKLLSSRLTSIANGLAGPLRGHPTLGLGEVSETNAHGLFDGYVRPFLVYGFQCGGGLGWLLWDVEPARAAVDRVLSGPPEGEETPEGDPMLTRTERRVLASMLDGLLDRVAGEFGVEVTGGEVWQEPEELTTLEDLGPDADSRRLLVHLTLLFEGEDQDEEAVPSDLRIYLPGIVDVDEPPPGDYSAGAPAHLEGVELEVAAHLGSTFVPLEELLAIEVGDVVPLNARVGDAVEIEVEETVIARGGFGARNGLLTVRVDEALDLSNLPIG